MNDTRIASREERDVLDDIGGEPLAGSGFEAEAVEESPAGTRTCPGCACSEHDACMTVSGPCSWVENSEYCSACVHPATRTRPSASYYALHGTG